MHTKSAEEDAQQAGSQLGLGRLPHRGGGIRSGGVLRLRVGVRLLVSLSIAGLLAVARCGLCGLAVLRLAVLRLSVCAGGLAVLRLLLAVASGGGLSVCGGLWGAIALRLLCGILAVRRLCRLCGLCRLRNTVRTVRLLLIISHAGQSPLNRERQYLLTVSAQHHLMFCPIVKPPRYDWAMRSFLTSWLIMTIAAAVMVAVTPGMTPVGEPPILGIAAFALFMALINASIKPVVHLIALPFAILSLGLVTLIINWLFMRLASWLAVSLFGVGVFVHGFWWSVLGSLVLTIVAGIVGSILDQ